MPTNIRLLMQILSIVIALLMLMEKVVAQSDEFLIGRLIKDPKTLTMNKTDMYRSIIGTPRSKTVIEYGGDFEKYFKARNSTGGATGKAFEALTVSKMNRFFEKSGSSLRMIASASEGRPHDVTDLAIIDTNRQNEVVERFQSKSSGRSGKGVAKALSEPKYADQNILTHPKMRRQIGTGNQGQLVSKIHGVNVPSYSQAERAAKEFLRKEFELFRPLPSPLAVSDEAASIAAKAAAKTAARTSGKALAWKLAGSGGMVFVGGADIGFGVHGMYEADRRYRLGELDSDIFTGKQVIAASQVGVGTATVIGGTVVALNAAGVTLFATPEPIVTKIAGGVVLVVSIGLGATDYVLDRTQAKRTESRRRLLAEIDERERYRIVFDELRGMVNGNNP